MYRFVGSGVVMGHLTSAGQSHNAHSVGLFNRIKYLTSSVLLPKPAVQETYLDTSKVRDEMLVVFNHQHLHPIDVCAGTTSLIMVSIDAEDRSSLIGVQATHIIPSSTES